MAAHQNQMSDGWHFCKVDVNDLSQFFLYIFHFTVPLLPFSNWSGHHYGSHFFHIFILWKNEKFASIFREKQRERKKSTSNNRLRYLCLKSSYCEKSWNFEKIITIFQSLARNEENLIFVFHPPPHFSVKYKELKKKKFFKFWPTVSCYSIPPQYSSILPLYRKKCFSFFSERRHRNFLSSSEMSELLLVFSKVPPSNNRLFSSVW